MTRGRPEQAERREHRENKGRRGQRDLRETLTQARQERMATRDLPAHRGRPEHRERAVSSRVRPDHPERRDHQGIAARQAHNQVRRDLPAHRARPARQGCRKAGSHTRKHALMIRSGVSARMIRRSNLCSCRSTTCAPNRMRERRLPLPWAACASPTMRGGRSR